jgi:hypothetical protein
MRKTAQSNDSYMMSALRLLGKTYYYETQYSQRLTYIRTTLAAYIGTTAYQLLFSAKGGANISQLHFLPHRFRTNSG